MTCIWFKGGNCWLLRIGATQCYWAWATEDGPTAKERSACLHALETKVD